jgi:hypothetical protein
MSRKKPAPKLCLVLGPAEGATNSGNLEGKDILHRVQPCRDQCHRPVSSSTNLSSVYDECSKGKSDLIKSSGRCAILLVFECWQAMKPIWSRRWSWDIRDKSTASGEATRAAKDLIITI